MPAKFIILLKYINLIIWCAYPQYFVGLLNNMKTSLFAGGLPLELMFEAMEKTCVILLCMTQKYKDSPNCRNGWSTLIIC